MIERDRCLALVEDAQRAGHVQASDSLLAALEASFQLTSKGKQAIRGKVA